MVAVMEEQPAAYHRPQATNCAPAPGMVAERVYDIETANHEYICTIWGGSPSLQGRNGVPSLAKALAGTQDAWKDQAQDDAMNHVAQVLSFDDDAAPQVTDQAPAALSLLNSSSLAAFVAALQGSRIWGNLEGPRIQRAMHKLGVLCAGAMQPGLAPVTICFFQKQPGSFEDLIVKLVDVVANTSCAYATPSLRCSCDECEECEGQSCSRDACRAALNVLTTLLRSQTLAESLSQEAQAQLYSVLAALSGRAQGTDRKAGARFQHIARSVPLQQLVTVVLGHSSGFCYGSMAGALLSLLRQPTAGMKEGPDDVVASQQGQDAGQPAHDQGLSHSRQEVKSSHGRVGSGQRQRSPLMEGLQLDLVPQKHYYNWLARHLQRLASPDALCTQAAAIPAVTHHLEAACVFFASGLMLPEKIYYGAVCGHHCEIAAALQATLQQVRQCGSAAMGAPAPPMVADPGFTCSSTATVEEAHLPRSGQEDVEVPQVLGQGQEGMGEVQGGDGCDQPGPTDAESGDMSWEDGQEEDGQEEDGAGLISEGGEGVGAADDWGEVFEDVQSEEWDDACSEWGCEEGCE